MTNSKPDFGLYSSRILTEKGFLDGTILIKNGLISKLIEGKLLNQDFALEDLNDLVIMPGLIDSHVHINEPGRTEWEGFETMTKASLAGGITTLVDMPLNASPVTTSKNAFEIKLKATEGKLYCNCAFWGGIVPDNIAFLDELIQSGVLGIKAFLTHSGIDDFPNVTLEDLKKGLGILKKYQVPLLVHAELDEMHDDLLAFEKNPTSYQAYLKSRPKIWEDKAVEMAISLCEEFDTPVHIVHLSSANDLDKIRAAKTKGLKLTVETCPQYLYFSAENIPDANTLFKCAPPIREKENNDKLWEALKDGTIDFIVTDHSPATPSLKEIESGNLKKAWGGIACIQFSLPIIWTEAQKRGFYLEEIAKLMSKNVADFIKLSDSKGLIMEGMDADLVVWNPEEKFRVEAKNIHYKHKISPYVGEELSGVVKQTYIKGKKVFENGNFVSLPIGEKILRKI
ncbi:MAG: allantoinase AllB [Bacteroidota bacterium]